MNQAEPPVGHVTLIFTDIEDSSRMTIALGAAYCDDLLLPHDGRIRAAVEAHRGHVVKTIGDSFMLAFQHATDAVACALAIQEAMAKPALAATDKTGKVWTLRVRIGIHRALEPLQPQRSLEFEADYRGSDVNFAARVESLATGGQILASEAARGAAHATVPAPWKEWPNRRIKSFDQPETVWELLWDGPSRGEPGSRFLPDWFKGEPNRYIPRPELEGRVLAEFGKLRPDGGIARLITLHAYGGMGKTRLAIACAVQVVGAFRDGVYFVKLDDKPRSATAVAEAIGTALGVGQEAAVPQKLIAALRDKDLLLLLDNYESVDSEEVQAFLIDLLKNTSAVRLLVTGREAVKLADVEQEISLDEGLTQSEGEALFLARARLKHRNGQQWQPAMSEREAIGRIVKLSEYIPVAIELAAAWVKHSEVKEIADGIAATPLGRQSQELPRSARLDQAERHRSLTRSLNYSMDRLEPWAREGLARLGVFADSFTPESVRAACDMPQAEELLFRLQDASLIHRFEMNGRSRYTMLRPTRAYAAEKLVVLPEAATLRQAFMDYFREAARQKAPLAAQTAAPAVKVSALDWIEEEWPNLLAAARWAFESEDSRTLMEMVGTVSLFWRLRGHWPEVEGLYGMALTVIRCRGDRGKEGQVLNDLGMVYNAQGRWAEAEKAYLQSLAISRESKDRLGEALTLNSLGGVYTARSRWAEAEKAFRESFEVNREIKNRMGEGQVLNNLAVIYKDQSRWGEAEQAFEQSLAISRELNDRNSEGITMGNLGNLHFRHQRWGEAERAYQQSLVIYREFTDRHGEAGALNNLGAVYREQGRWAEAERAYQQSAAIYQQFKDRRGEAGASMGWGNIYRARGQRAEAERAFQQSLSIYRELQDLHGEGDAFDNLGQVYLEQGRWDEAEQACRQALAIAREFRDRNREGATLSRLGQVHRAQQRWEEGANALQQGLAIARELKDQPSVGRNLYNLGIIYGAQKRWGEAQQHYLQSVEIFREVKDRTLEMKAEASLGGVYAAQNQLEESEQALQRSSAIEREIMGRKDEADTLNMKGSIHRKMAQWAEAEQAFQQCLAIRREGKDRQGEGNCLMNLALLYNDLRRWSESETAFHQCISIFRERDNRLLEAMAIGGLAMVFQKQERWAEAEQTYRRSLVIYQEIKEARYAGVVLYNLAVIRGSQKDYRATAALLRDCIAVLETTDNHELLKSARHLLSSVEEYFKSGRV